MAMVPVTTSSLSTEKVDAAPTNAVLGYCDTTPSRNTFSTQSSRPPTRAPHATGARAFWTTLGDVDGDGLLDILVANRNTDLHPTATDTVAIEQCRPLSKTKAWRLHSIVERAR